MGVIIGVFLILGVPCLVKFLTGISCPGCGMTRAYISLLSFDFTRAFYYHPLWPIVPVFIVCLFWVGDRHARFRRGVLVATSALMLTVYVVRMFTGPAEVMIFDPKSSVFYRAFEFFKGIFNSKY